MILKYLHSESFKPEVHLKDIFKALNIINPNEKSIRKQTLKPIDTIAIHNITPYAIDKIFWLLRSDNLYLNNLKIGNKKKEFINL